MKSSVLLAAVLFSTNVFAALPSVSCSPMYNFTDAKGISKDFKVGNSLNASVGKGDKTLMYGFVAAVQLRQICAFDGGPCSEAAQLDVNVSKGESEAYATKIISKEEVGKRFSASLKVGQESLFLNCDVK